MTDVITDELREPLFNDIFTQINSLNTGDNVVLGLLKNSLPGSDVNGISEELNKKFILDKIKSNVAIKKPKKRKYLSIKLRKLLELKKTRCKKDLKYEDVLSLNNLWLEYIQQAIGGKSFLALPQSPEHINWETVGQRLMKSDLHGAKIIVIRSKCPSLIGIEGIILQDTRNTFQVIGKDNIIRTLLKQIIVVKIHLIEATLEFFGKELCLRSAERSVRKYKANHLPEL
ncbi:hypothetical protein HCN44_000376 [Aphidius gifuensis]|uniref:Ribonuclease P protein subunit p29 n=1 Tax=Aphidius gifuensis TaxID=684658 RepID=A0A834XTL1_APHGI|nr:ribonuclease P protein subunit p29 [Aphidius gifuensis]KAF7990571.1 hypothetical protein HCN44_000376 [Aphidius gifuensis]